MRNYNGDLGQINYLQQSRIYLVLFLTQNLNKMKILFVINDGDARRMEYEYTGVLNAPNRRLLKLS